MVYYHLCVHWMPIALGKFSNVHVLIKSCSLGSNYQEVVEPLKHRCVKEELRSLRGGACAGDKKTLAPPLPLCFPAITGIFVTQV